jgi:hypothetical protein
VYVYEEPALGPSSSRTARAGRRFQPKTVDEHLGHLHFALGAMRITDPGLDFEVQIPAWFVGQTVVDFFGPGADALESPGSDQVLWPEGVVLTKLISGRGQVHRHSSKRLSRLFHQRDHGIGDWVSRRIRCRL